MLKLVRSEHPKIVKAVYKDGKFVELWANETDDFYWLKYDLGESSGDKFGWSRYEMASMHFDRFFSQVYNK
jgi:hypothetical protein